MPLISRLSSAARTPVQKSGPDKLFGNGVDGTVVIAANTFLSRDMYYDTLTVNSTFTLFTNGFRVFVKGTLTNNGTVGMPAGTAQTTSVLAGTVLTRIDGTGGFSTGQSIDSTNSSGTLPVGNVKDFDSLLSGVSQSGASLSRFYVGAVGTPGATGNAGNLGTAGNAGTANAGGAAPSPSGGATAGNQGTAGTQGMFGAAGSGGAGGTGGQGGGVVVVVAKTITGAGTFVSEPTTGNVGSSGNPGGAGNPGNAGVAGNAGTTVAGTSAHNPTGHAVGHNPVGHAGAHNAAAHNPEASYHCCSSHNGKYGAHNPGWHHVNAYAHHTPATVYYHSHPGSSFHYSHPGTQYHNPTYPGGAAGTANPGNPGTSGNAGGTGGTGATGKQGGLVVLTRNISTHIATGNTTFVQDIDG
jgi:hypothetical protein